MIKKFYVYRINPKNNGTYQFAVITKDPRWNGLIEIDLEDSFFEDDKIRRINLFDSVKDGTLTTGTGMPMASLDVRAYMYYLPEDDMTAAYIQTFLTT